MLTPNQERALAALLTKPSREAAARECGLTPLTLRKYEQQPEFAAELTRRRRNALAIAYRSIVCALSDAVQCLADTVRNPDAADRDRIAAARALLDHGLKYSDAVDLEHRVTVLEEAQDNAAT